MNVSKLLKASSMIKASKPEIAEELSKIAQDLSGMPMDAPMDMPTNPMPAEMPQPSMNPNIKNYATPTPNEQEKVTHKISFNIEVPKDWGELEIMNELLPVLKQFSERDPNISIKGYQFTQS